MAPADKFIILQVKVVPGASRNRVAGRYGDGIKVQVTAPPEKVKANHAVIAILAQWLDIHPTLIEITAGLTQPRKTVRLGGLAAETLQAKLNTL